MNKIQFLKNYKCGTSLVVQWVRLHAPNAGGLGLIPGRGTRSHMHATTKSPHAAKSPHATTKTRHSQNKKINKLKKNYKCNFFSLSNSSMNLFSRYSCTFSK